MTAKKKKLERILAFELEVELYPIKLELDKQTLALLLRVLQSLGNCFTRPDLPMPKYDNPFEKVGIMVFLRVNL